ncbi:MAG: SDR family NAD(P)-dependent oxidoreductase, partial [Proteobacteria bacterium]
LVTAEDGKIADAGNAFQSFGGLVQTVQADLAKPEGVDKLYQSIKALNRPVDSLAINAGVGVGGAFTKTDLKDEMNLIQLNIVSVVHLAKHLVRDMVAAGHGRILFTSSVAAEMPGPYYAVYAASKAFVQSFAEALRHEVKESGVTITALQPGPTDTNFFARADMTDTPAGQGKKDNPADVALDGYKALMAGKDGVVAGSMMNTVQAGMARMMTEEMQAKAQGKQTKPNNEGH